MKDASSSKATPPTDGFTSLAGFAPWFDTYKHATEAWSQVVGNYFKSNMELCQEISSFAQSRLQADAEVMKDLVSCRNPADFTKIQQAFANNASNAYTSEASKLAARASSFMKDSTAAFTTLSELTH